MSSFASFVTLLIEDLHVQFKKPSSCQAEKRKKKKKGKTLLMRKGNLVPLSLPAGGHRDLGRRINRAPPCPSGQPDSSHAPGIGHPGRGDGRPRVPASSLLERLAGLVLHGLGEVLPGSPSASTQSLFFSPGL